VYECDKSEAEELKKALSYDPYLDSNLIPPAGKDKPADQLTEEEKKAQEERDKKIAEAHKMLESSPKGKYIFARQDYSLRDGSSVGLKGDKSYIYLSAPDDFLKGAEERFKTEFKTVKRASKEEEEKVISVIKDEEERANAGFGSIFGG